MPVIPGQVMPGVAPLVGAIVDRLTATIEDELDRLEAAFGRPVPVLVPPDDPASDLWRLPGLISGNPQARVEPDDYPAVLVVPQATESVDVADVVDGAAVFDVPYRIRVWAFCRYFTGPGVVACRDRLGLAIRQSLFRRPRLDDTRHLDLGSWRESFSDVDVDERDQNTVAGYWLDLLAHQIETVTLDTLANANTITVAVHPEAD